MTTLSKSPIALLRLAWNTIFSNPAVLFPFAILVFIQVLILEIIFFAPRYPLSLFFGPIISKMEGAGFLHYPLNYLLLLKWSHSIQMILFVFLNCFFIGAAVLIIEQINSNKIVQLRQIFREALSRYINLFVFAVINIVLVQFFSLGHGLLIQRAMAIKSVTGIFFFIKQAVLLSAPLVQLLFAFILGALFAFVIPIVMLERKKIFTAFWINFREFGRSFGIMFWMITLSGILYLPIILIKSYLSTQPALFPPEALGIILILGVLVMALIDAWQYTAITIYYLDKKEGAK